MLDDVDRKLEQLAELVENARAMPMSASCIVNRAEVLSLVDELRALLPSEVREAKFLLGDREGVIAEGRVEADAIIAGAHTERARLVSETEVMALATEESERVVAEAREEAASMRREVDDYVDQKLATFEVVLTKTLTAVERGRERLHGRIDADFPAEDVEALPN
ncbi:MAG: hypothetical protein QOG52_2307 [Frankiaceae bacterium]|nr:hypothetical protein [Frankiaceae bacterium]MDQ1714852.1 hypothetical protein [Frankiaceae bacterium]MDQ1725279.1 hypothetical protein [Frankiaceae bacterium]